MNHHVINDILTGQRPQHLSLRQGWTPEGGGDGFGSVSHRSLASDRDDCRTDWNKTGLCTVAALKINKVYWEDNVEHVIEIAS
jgi:hypothetical protein